MGRAEQIVFSSTLPLAESQPVRLQKSPFNPISANTSSASSGLRRRHEGSSRSWYQVSASRHICSGVMNAPFALPDRSTCSSDLKSSIALHVKTMSSHQWRAGTEKWTAPSDSMSFPSDTRSRSGSVQSGQEVSTTPSPPSRETMPSESHTQLPWYDPPRALILNDAGTTEKGLAIRKRDGSPGSHTNTWLSPSFAYVSCTISNGR